MFSLEGGVVRHRPRYVKKGLPSINTAMFFHAGENFPA
jgi:hypothetical protein